MKTPGVVGVMLINQDGLAVRTTLSQDETLKFGGQIVSMVEKSRKFMEELAANDDNRDMATASGQGTSAHHPHHHLHHPDHEQHQHDTIIRIRTMNYEVVISPCGKLRQQSTKSYLERKSFSSPVWISRHWRILHGGHSEAVEWHCGWGGRRR